MILKLLYFRKSTPLLHTTKLPYVMWNPMSGYMVMNSRTCLRKKLPMKQYHSRNKVNNLMVSTSKNSKWCTGLKIGENVCWLMPTVGRRAFNYTYSTEVSKRTRSTCTKLRVNTPYCCTKCSKGSVHGYMVLDITMSISLMMLVVSIAGTITV